MIEVKAPKVQTWTGVPYKVPQIFNIFLYELSETNLDTVRVWITKEKFVDFPTK